jgi:hypothetical protein
MLNNKFIIYLFFILIFILYSCGTSRIPNQWLPADHEGFAYNATGAYIFIEFNMNGNEFDSYTPTKIKNYIIPNNDKNDNLTLVSVEGEFIGMKSDTIYLITYTSNIYKILTSKITNAQLVYSDRYPSVLFTYMALKVPIDITFFTVSLWSLVLNKDLALYWIIYILTMDITDVLIIAESINEGKRNKFDYEADRSDLNWFNYHSSFARFPQGITDDIDLSHLAFLPQVVYKKTYYRGLIK